MAGLSPIAVQSMRSPLPAVLPLVRRDAPLVAVAAMLPVGERCAGLSCRWPPGGCARQTVGEAAGSCAARARRPGLVVRRDAVRPGRRPALPVVVRRGHISSYEMSDRMYAASQFISMAFLVRRVGGARLPTMSADDGSSLLRRDGRTLGAVTTVLTAAGSARLVFVALWSGLLPVDWRQGFRGARY